MCLDFVSDIIVPAREFSRGHGELEMVLFPSGYKQLL
jgi:hypothetical protein